MICRAGEGTVAGRAVDLRSCEAVEDADLDPETVATAVREGAATTAEGTRVSVLARTPGPLHHRVGCVTPAVSIRPRTALAVAARSRGWTTPVDDDLVAARERLRAHRAGEGDTPRDEDRPETTARRRDLAAVTADVDRLRERAAEARGRLQASDAGETTAPSDGEAPLAAAIRELSEAETAAAAARERHRRARDAARDRRDRLQERLHVADEVRNLEREARAHLVGRARDAYETALGAVPGGPDSTPPSDPFAAEPDAMALAVARVGDVSAPVVLAGDRFSDAGTAARWLGAPVVRL